MSRPVPRAKVVAFRRRVECALFEDARRIALDHGIMLADATRETLADAVWQLEASLDKYRPVQRCYKNKEGFIDRRLRPATGAALEKIVDAQTALMCLHNMIAAVDRHRDLWNYEFYEFETKLRRVYAYPEKTRVALVHLFEQSP